MFFSHLAAKGTYYLNCKTGQASMTAIACNAREASRRTKVRAVCIDL